MKGLYVHVYTHIVLRTLHKYSHVRTSYKYPWLLVISYKYPYVGSLIVTVYCIIVELLYLPSPPFRFSPFPSSSSFTPPPPPPPHPLAPCTAATDKGVHW